MKTAKDEMIEKLRALRDEIAEVEVWVDQLDATSALDDDMKCCQESGWHWFAVCDICVENGEASKRLGPLAKGVIALYESEWTRASPWTGSYNRFLDNAVERSYDAVVEALYEQWSPDDDDPGD